MKQIILLLFIGSTNFSLAGEINQSDKDGFFEVRDWGSLYLSKKECLLEKFARCGSSDHVTTPLIRCEVDKTWTPTHYKADSLIGCAKKSSTVFTSNLECPSAYSTFEVSSPPYAKGRKKLCVALHAVNAFALPGIKKCPEGFAEGVDRSNMQNKLCIRDQRIQRKTSTGCDTVGPSEEEPEDKTFERQIMRCTSNGLSYEFQVVCKKGTPLGKCISEVATQNNKQKLQATEAAR